MPKYNYQCRSCAQSFIIEVNMTEKRDNVACDHCHSQDVFRIFAGVGVRVSAAVPDMPGFSDNTASSCHRCGSPDPCS